VLHVLPLIDPPDGVSRRWFENVAPECARSSPLNIRDITDPFAAGAVLHRLDRRPGKTRRPRVCRSAVHKASRPQND
jgi:hypothetical protein